MKKSYLRPIYCFCFPCTGQLTGPFHDKKNLDSEIFGRSVKEPKTFVKVETYLAKSEDISTSMSGSEVVSRTIDLGHVCTVLEEIDVTLNFTSPALSSTVPSPYPNLYLCGSQSSPSNLELTIGKLITFKLNLNIVF